MGIESGAESQSLDPVGLAVDIVSAFVGNNSLPATELATLVQSVHAELIRLSAGVVSEPPPTLVPAVPIKKSIQPNFLVCLEDGKTFKSLKRHLRARYKLTPEDYRARWNLPADYPMVAPNYAAARSRLAKDMGLGQQRRKDSEGEPEAEPAEPAAPKRRTRKKLDA